MGFKTFRAVTLGQVRAGFAAVGPTPQAPPGFFSGTEALSVAQREEQ